MGTVYQGIAGARREMASAKAGIGGVMRDVTEIYAGVGGVRQLVWNAAAGAESGEYPKVCAAYRVGWDWWWNVQEVYVADCTYDWVTDDEIKITFYGLSGPKWLWEVETGQIILLSDNVESGQDIMIFEDYGEDAVCGNIFSI